MNDPKGKHSKEGNSMKRFIFLAIIGFIISITPFGLSPLFGVHSEKILPKQSNYAFSVPGDWRLVSVVKGDGALYHMFFQDKYGKVFIVPLEEKSTGTWWTDEVGIYSTD